MATGQVFKRDDVSVRKLLQSNACLQMTEKAASNYADGSYIRPFVGFDRAKCFVYKKRTKK